MVVTIFFKLKIYKIITENTKNFIKILNFKMEPKIETY